MKVWESDFNMFVQSEVQEDRARPQELLCDRACSCWIVGVYQCGWNANWTDDKAFLKLDLTQTAGLHTVTPQHARPHKRATSILSRRSYFFLSALIHSFTFCLPDGFNLWPRGPAVPRSTCPHTKCHTPWHIESIWRLGAGEGRMSYL